MGQAVLWPRGKFAVEKVDVSRIADTQTHRGPRTASGPVVKSDNVEGGGLIAKLLAAIGVAPAEAAGASGGGGGGGGGPGEKKDDFNAWKETLRREVRAPQRRV